MFMLRRVSQRLSTAFHRADTVEANQTSVERAILHMKERLAEPLKLDELARVAAISKFHLVRVFDEVTGTTPAHFFSCLRMQRAKELMLSSETSITDICMEVGYTSLGSFSKTFNALVGVSPQEFRRLPKRLTPLQFAKAVWRYLATDEKITGPKIEGVVEGPRGPQGFTFVGAFTGGVPQGAPFSGTVMLKRGKFSIARPDVEEFHLLAALIPFSADLTAIVATLPIGLVASHRVQTGAAKDADMPRLRLRPLRVTDPPIVLALPALPPWRGTFAK